MEKGDLVQLEGRQHWFRYEKHTPGGDVVLWGPLTAEGRAKVRGQWVNVKPEEVK